MFDVCACARDRASPPFLSLSLSAFVIFVLIVLLLWNSRLTKISKQSIDYAKFKAKKSREIQKDDLERRKKNDQRQHDFCIVGQRFRAFWIIRRIPLNDLKSVWWYVRVTLSPVCRQYEYISNIPFDISDEIMNPFMINASNRDLWFHAFEADIRRESGDVSLRWESFGGQNNTKMDAFETFAKRMFWFAFCSI